MRTAVTSGIRVARPTSCAAGTPASSSVVHNRHAPHVAPRRPALDDVPAHPSTPEMLEHFLWVPVSDAFPQASEQAVGTSLPWQTALRQASPFEVAGPFPWAGGPTLIQRTEEYVFSVQVDEKPTPPSSQKRPDFYANVGDAIRTLREDIPILFAKDLDYSIYREDIVFKDPNLQFKGMKNYKIIFWSLRFHGRLFFKQIYVDVLRIWQPEDHQIKMRWRVHAAPRGWWQTAGTFDGISTYKLDNEGKIYEHMIDNVQLRDPPITNPLLYGLNYVLAPRLRPQQVPCPGSWGFTKHGNESECLHTLSSVDH